MKEMHAHLESGLQWTVPVGGSGSQGVRQEPGAPGCCGHHPAPPSAGAFWGSGPAGLSPDPSTLTLTFRDANFQIILWRKTQLVCQLQERLLFQLNLRYMLVCYSRKRKMSCFRINEINSKKKVFHSRIVNNNNE